MGKEPLTEIEFYLKRLEKCVRDNKDRYALQYLLVDRNTNATSECRMGNGDELLTGASYLLTKTILDLIIAGDMNEQEIAELLQKVTMNIIDIVGESVKDMIKFNGGTTE